MKEGQPGGLGGMLICAPAGSSRGCWRSGAGGKVRRLRCRGQWWGGRDNRRGKEMEQQRGWADRPAHLRRPGGGLGMSVWQERWCC